MTSRRFGGRWTARKLEILQEYLRTYTTALKNQSFRLTYVDAFAGAGSYEFASDEDDYEEFRELRRGSTWIALDIDDKPFDRLVFIEKDTGAAENLLILANEYPGRQIEVIQGDANVEIPKFCANMAWNDRAVVFLDPYATQVSWSTVEAVAKSRKIDCWILFPLMAVTRMMPTDREPDEATAEELDRVFGERRHWLESYRDSPQMSLFDGEPRRERAPGSEQIADRYRNRLSTIFHSVAQTPCTLTNSKEHALVRAFIRGQQSGRGAHRHENGESYTQALVNHVCPLFLGRRRGVCQSRPPANHAPASQGVFTLL